MSTLSQKVIRAHGGSRRLRSMTEVMACVSLGGWEFTSRLHPRPLRDVEVTAAIDACRATLTPFPAAGMIGHFRDNRVWIESEAGACLGERDDPAATLRSPRHWLAWDSLDVLYYGGALLWQALTLPFLIARSEVILQDLQPISSGDGRWQRLSIRFPEALSLLADEHVLFCDPAGLVHRIDFSSPLYGSWIGLTQIWSGHESFGGLVYPTRQSMHPRLLNDQVWRLTALVWMELDDITPVSRGAVSSGDTVSG